MVISTKECDLKMYSFYSSADSLVTANGLSTGSEPQSAMTTSFAGLSCPPVFVFSTLRTTFWRQNAHTCVKHRLNSQVAQYLVLNTALLIGSLVHGSPVQLVKNHPNSLD